MERLMVLEEGGRDQAGGDDDARRISLPGCMTASSAAARFRYRCWGLIRLLPGTRVRDSTPALQGETDHKQGKIVAG